MKFFAAAIGIICASVLAGASAYAGTIPNGLQKSLCQQGTQAKRSESFSSASGGVSALEKMVGSTNFCTNEQVSLDRGFLSATLDDKITCICTNEQQFASVGCGEGQTQPAVTVDISRSVSGCKTDSITISKCVEDPEGAYRASCASGVSLAQAMVLPQAVAPAPAQGAQPSSFSLIQSASAAPLPASSPAATVVPPEPAFSARQPATPAQPPPGENANVSGSPLEGGIAPDVPVRPETFVPIEQVPAQLAPNATTALQPQPPAQSPQILVVREPSNFSASNPSLFGLGGLGGFGSLSLLAPLQNALRTLFQPPAQTLIPPPPPPPTATLTAQPQTVVRGNLVTVSWVADGVSASAPCTLDEDGTLIAQGVVGNISVPTGSSTPSTTLFDLQCQGAFGQSVRQSAAVTVR